MQFLRLLLVDIINYVSNYVAINNFFIFYSFLYLTSEWGRHRKYMHKKAAFHTRTVI